MPLSKTVTEFVFKYKRKMGHQYFVGNQNWSQGRKNTRCSVNERNVLLWFTTGTYLFAKWLWWWEDLRDENASYMGLGKHVVTVLLNCLETNAWRETFFWPTGPTSGAALQGATVGKSHVLFMCSETDLNFRCNIFLWVSVLNAKIN
jgi:hypothetical protein